MPSASASTVACTRDGRQPGTVRAYARWLRHGPTTTQAGGAAGGPHLAEYAWCHSCALYAVGESHCCEGHGWRDNYPIEGCQQNLPTVNDSHGSGRPCSVSDGVYGEVQIECVDLAASTHSVQAAATIEEQVT